MVFLKGIDIYRAWELANLQYVYLFFYQALWIGLRKLKTPIQADNLLQYFLQWNERNFHYYSWDFGGTGKARNWPYSAVVTERYQHTS